MIADVKQRKGMAAVFASLPCKVLWRLPRSDIPDAAAIAELALGNNTNVGTPICDLRPTICFFLFPRVVNPQNRVANIQKECQLL